MQLKQANLVLAVSMAVVGAIVIVSGVLVFQSFQKASEARNERDQKFTSFKRTCAKDPFPNAKNIAQMGENVETVSNWYGNLLSGLGEPLSIPRSEAASIFGSRREQVISSLREDAPMGLGGTKVVTPEFMFGFDAYREGKMPKMTEVPRLLYQLELVDDIARAMYDSHVLAITRFERDVFEQGSSAEASADEEESSGSRRRRGRRSSSSSDDSDSESESASARDAVGNLTDFDLPLNCQNFVLEFKAKEESLIALLNRLSEMPRYVAVTGLEFSKVDSDFARVKEETPEPRPTAGRRVRGSRAEPEKVPEVAAVSVEPASRLARSFTGKNLESPISVKMNLAVYASIQAVKTTEEEEN